jgi:predicted protein tyrosine phosphatase
MKHYLFVCLANRNRSPTGQDVFQDMLVERGYKVWQVNSSDMTADFEVISAGTYADEKGLEMTEDLGERMDVIFAMSNSILEDLVKSFNVPRDKIINLDIPDIYSRNELGLIKILKDKLLNYIPQVTKK